MQALEIHHSMNSCFAKSRRTLRVQWDPRHRNGSSTGSCFPDWIWEFYSGPIRKQHLTVRFQHQMIKIAWIQRIQQCSEAGWKVVPERPLSYLDGFAFLSHCRYDINLLQLHNPSPFIALCWSTGRSYFAEDITQIQNEIIWNNSNILINKNALFFKNWYESGIIRLQDLLDADFTFLSARPIATEIPATSSLY